jgi:hypothetical protein
MSRTQNSPIGNEFKAEVVQRNLEDLFQFAHEHVVRTTAPSASEGAVGDVIPVVISGVGYLYVKFPSIGWKRVQLT